MKTCYCYCTVFDPGYTTARVLDPYKKKKTSLDNDSFIKVRNILPSFQQSLVSLEVQPNTKIYFFPLFDAHNLVVTVPPSPIDSYIRTLLLRSHTYILNSINL